MSSLPNPWFHFPHPWKGTAILSQPVMKLTWDKYKSSMSAQGLSHALSSGLPLFWYRSVVLKVWSGGEQHQTPLELLIMQIINLTEPRPTESVSQGRAQQLAILLPLSEVAQLYLTLCDPVGCSPTGSSVHGILQARILEWVAISFSRGSSWPRDQTQVSHTAGRHFNLWASRAS